VIVVNEGKQAAGEKCVPVPFFVHHRFYMVYCILKLCTYICKVRKVNQTVGLIKIEHLE
jgi:hypothetical protein